MFLPQLWRNTMKKPTLGRLAAPLSFALALATAASAQTSPPSWESTTKYAVGNLVSVAQNQNYYRCIAPNTDKSPLSTPGDWELSQVHGSLVVSVETGTPFGSLTTAFN